MHYIYTLKHPKTSLIYIGYTDNLERRMKEHQKDKPRWKLIYCESYLSRMDALHRERRLKQYGSSLGHLRTRIYHSLRES